MDELPKYTRETLSQFDGAKGHSAYIAYEGKVYDVSDSVYWPDGDHFDQHWAGRDLTDELKSAPHDEKNVLNCKVVGTYVGS